MNRVLGSMAWWSSLLAVVCLALALVALPTGELRADEPSDEEELVPCLFDTCGPTSTQGFCQGSCYTYCTCPLTPPQGQRILKS